MPRDRFLTAILAGIVVLALLALVLFFVRQGLAKPVDETFPQGVVQNYILALQQEDYKKAYTYLADGTSKPSLIDFQQPFVSYLASEIANTPVEIGDATLHEASGTAVVQITLIRGGRGIFEDVYRETQAAQLVRQENEWRISSFPYPYWAYDWMTPIAPASFPTVTSTPP